MFLVQVKRPGFEMSTKGDVKSKTMLCHMLAEKVYQDRLCVEIATAKSTNTIGIFCTVEDTLTGEKLTRLGESALEEEFPIKSAYEKAFVSAIEDFLDIKISKPKENEQEVQEEQNAEELVAITLSMPDETVLLFGNLKGKTYGEVKDTPQFMHFLEQLQNTPNLHFANDSAKQTQLEALLKLEIKEESQ